MSEINLEDELKKTVWSEGIVYFFLMIIFTPIGYLKNVLIKGSIHK